ncbi:delta-aminolevulinic acid dehydratase/porphobilinogen synthase [Labrenzia sp. MBR-25]
MIEFDFGERLKNRDLTLPLLDSTGSNSGKEVMVMTSHTDWLERDILRVFRSACQHGRSDIAEFMLAALEKLDSERANSATRKRPLIDAYQEIAGFGASQR